MNNDDSFNRADFAQFLLHKGIVTPGTEKYFVHWLDLFQRSRKNWPEHQWHDQLPMFLELLKQTKGRKEWQVQQAELAVRLYFTSYLNKYKKEPPHQPLLIVVNGQSFSSAETLEMFEDTLKVKHFSDHIIKNYLHWTKTFLLYLENRQGFSEKFHLSDAQYGVKKFMVHLAVQQDISAAAQNQAFSSLSLFFRYIFDYDII
ncbi:MAG: phage integrase N-terminal SAM-like domain-containing protein [Desulfocapsaceae bacterium]|nr:phage integrase N-terminal SAM-like domain-containing protein [Desulfocapsaceae bacterium]